MPDDLAPSNLELLGRAVKEVQYRHHRAMDARLSATAGTSLVQWDALRAIGRNPGASAHTLAQLTFQSDQAFGTLAGRLIALGLIERTPGHGRRIEHHLTAAGRAVLDAGLPVAERMLAHSFADLSPDERSTLLALLSRVAPDDLASS